MCPVYFLVFFVKFFFLNGISLVVDLKGSLLPLFVKCE